MPAAVEVKVKVESQGQAADGPPAAAAVAGETEGGHLQQAAGGGQVQRAVPQQAAQQQDLFSLLQESEEDAAANGAGLTSELVAGFVPLLRNLSDQEVGDGAGAAMLSRQVHPCCSSYSVLRCP